MPILDKLLPRFEAMFDDAPPSGTSLHHHVGGFATLVRLEVADRVDTAQRRALALSDRHLQLTGDMSHQRLCAVSGRDVGGEP